MQSAERPISERFSSERLTIAGADLARWLVAAALVAAGLGLFFVYAPQTRPVVQLSVHEAGS
jgi:hypothetical protein